MDKRSTIGGLLLQARLRVNVELDLDTHRLSQPSPDLHSGRTVLQHLGHRGGHRATICGERTGNTTRRWSRRRSGWPILAPSVHSMSVRLMLPSITARASRGAAGPVVAPQRGCRGAVPPSCSPSSGRHPSFRSRRGRGASGCVPPRAPRRSRVSHTSFMPPPGGLPSYTLLSGAAEPPQRFGPTPLAKTVLAAPRAQPTRTRRAKHMDGSGARSGEDGARRAVRGRRGKTHGTRRGTRRDAASRSGRRGARPIPMGGWGGGPAHLVRAKGRRCHG